MKGKLEYWTEILFRVVYSSSVSNIWVWVIMAFTLVFAVNINQLRFNYNIEGFFSNEDSEVARYENFKNKFGNENNVLLIGIESRAGIFNQDFLSKIDTISTALKSIEAVRKVISPTNLREYIATPTTGLIPIPIIHVNDPEELADILEVVHGLAACIGISINELEKIRLAKVKSNGGFEKGIFLVAADP